MPPFVKILGKNYFIGTIGFARCATKNRSGFASAGEILDHHPDGLFVGRSEDRLTAPLTPDKARAPELLYVVGYRRERKVDAGGHVAHRSTAGAAAPGPCTAHADMLEDGKAVPVGQGLECFDKKIPVNLLLILLCLDHFLVPRFGISTIINI